MCAEIRNARVERGEVTRRARGDAGASNARRRLEKKNRSECLLSLLSLQEASALRSCCEIMRLENGETPGEWNTPGAPAERRSARALWHISILDVCVTPHSPPLIENLCARIDDDATRTRGCVAGSGVTPRAVRPRRARRGPSSRILRSVWVILGGAHRVARRCALSDTNTLFRPARMNGTHLRYHSWYYYLRYHSFGLHT